MSYIKNFATFVKKSFCRCVLCDYGMSEHGVCKDCLQSCLGNDRVFSLPYIKEAYSGWLYQFPLRNILHAFKYQRDQRYATALQYLLWSAISNWCQGFVFDCVVPVPLHKRKERLRGFNQSYLLAQVCAKNLAIPLYNELVKRVEDTDPQAECTNKQERRENVRNAFSVQSNCKSSILLIDDMITSGSTVSELARTLKRAGAKRVYVASLCVSFNLVSKGFKNVIK